MMLSSDDYIYRNPYGNKKNQHLLEKKKDTGGEKKSGYICFLRMESKLKKTQAYLDLAASTQRLSSSVHKWGLLAQLCVVSNTWKGELARLIQQEKCK